MTAVLFGLLVLLILCLIGEALWRSTDPHGFWNAPPPWRRG